MKKIFILVTILLFLFSFSVSAALRDYNYRYYNFKIDTTTGALTSVTVAGQAQPTITNITTEYWNFTGSRYNKFAVNITAIRNTSLYDLIVVSFALRKETERVCIVNETWRFFEDNQTFYFDSLVEATPTKICHLYRGKIKVYGNSPNYWARSYFAKNLSFRGSTYDSSSTFKKNYSVNSGTGTNNANYANESYIGVMNTSNGWVAVGFQDMSEQMASGLNRQFNPSYLIADTNDSFEGMINWQQWDYILYNPNITMSFYDSATERYIMRDVNFGGLPGVFKPQSKYISYQLRPAIKRDFKTAQDAFRMTSFFQLRNSTGKKSYEVPVRALENDLINASGEKSGIGMRYAIWKLHYSNGESWAGTNTTEYPTQAHLKVEVQNDKMTGYQMLLDHCFYKLWEYARYGGWWRYPDIKTSYYYWGGYAFLGNAYDSMYSCNYVYSSSWLSAYPDVKILIDTIRNSYTSIYHINNEDITGRNQRFYSSVSDYTMIFNRSYAEKSPEFNLSKTIQEKNGTFRLYFVGNAGFEKWRVSMISCNATDGTRLWGDNFTIDSSTSYVRSKFTYKNNPKGMYCNITNTGDTICSMYPNVPLNNHNATKWKNYRCSFDIQPVGNWFRNGSASTQLGYIWIYMRANTSDTDTNGIRYYSSGQSPSRIKIHSSSVSAYTYMYYINDSYGVYFNNWTIRNTHYKNQTAIQAKFISMVPNSTSLTANIINQKNYFDVNLADLIYIATIRGWSSNLSYYSRFMDKVVQGNNWQIRNDNINIRRDGFWEYSNHILNKDNGYYINSLYQQSKIQRSTITRFDYMPFICYYNRYGRENKSESTSASNFSTINALLSVSDSRCSTYSSYKPKVSMSIGEDNIAISLYPQESDTTFFKYTNCSSIYNDKVPIYYPDSHVSVNPVSSNMWNVQETCTNARVKNVNYAIINDAYQVYSTSYVYLDILPINNPRHIWNAANAESYPIGTYASNSPMWDYNLHRFKQNNTHFIYNDSSFVITKKSSIVITLKNGVPSNNYTIKVNGWNVTTFSTNSNGAGIVSFDARDNSNISIHLGNSIVNVTVASISSNMEQYVKDTFRNFSIFIPIAIVLAVILSLVFGLQSGNFSGLFILISSGIGFFIMAMIFIIIANVLR